MEKTLCVRCRQNMPLLRLSKYGYNYCVNCSTTAKVRYQNYEIHLKTNNKWVVLLDYSEHASLYSAERHIDYLTK
jgi:predicted amidophosphoribosyltransferase